MKKLLLLMTLMLSTTSFSEDKLVSPDMPIDLVADSGSYDQLAGIAIYQGNVVLTQGVSTIWADKLSVFVKDNAAERVEATGYPVKFEYKGKEQPITGSGNRIVYHVKTEVITLSGNAVVRQGKDTVRGNQLTYNLRKEIVGGQRIKMTFLPKKK
ncbi:MAG: lipopolysaccharide transport periplasmic protein LptA [Gammaproteobacteria bacterium]|nr:MAG: lipopolysaccharide transport periplasmic protein LptA [Gammaproteobacteria bacterium]